MKLKEFITEANDDGPIGSFIGGFKQGRALNFTGKPSDAAPEKKKLSNKAGTADLRIDRYQINDLKYVMQAVIKGNTNSLSSQQIDSARELLKKLNDA